MNYARPIWKHILSEVSEISFQVHKAFRSEIVEDVQKQIDTEIQSEQEGVIYERSVTATFKIPMIEFVRSFEHFVQDCCSQPLMLATDLLHEWFKTAALVHER